MKTPFAKQFCGPTNIQFSKVTLYMYKETIDFSCWIYLSTVNYKHCLGWENNHCIYIE